MPLLCARNHTQTPRVPDNKTLVMWKAKYKSHELVPVRQVILDIEPSHGHFFVILKIYLVYYFQAYPPYPSSPVQVITGNQLPVYNYQVIIEIIKLFT